MTALQASLFFDLFPAGVAVVLVTTGVVIAVATIVAAGGETNRLRWLAVSGVVLGGLLFMYGVAQMDVTPMMIGVVLIAGYIEGMSSLRIYQKLRYSFRRRVLPGSASTVVSLSTRAILGALGVYVLVAGVWVALFLVVWGPIEVGLTRTVQFYWALVTVVISSIGLWVKLGGDSIDGMATGAKLGTVFIIVGAEVYNFQSLRLNLLVYLGTSAAYTVGYFVAVSRAVSPWSSLDVTVGEDDRQLSVLFSEIAAGEEVFSGVSVGFLLGMVLVSLVTSLGVFYIVLRAGIV
jgi:hypothetical protein